MNASRAPRSLVLIGIVSFSLLLGAACREAPKKAEPPPEEPSMRLAEQTQGRDLCAGYVERLCACAQKTEAFTEPCQLAQGQTEAVALNMRLLAGEMGTLNAKERRRVEINLRKVIKACVAADAKLELGACPRPK